jgi:hypothetical protein
MTYCSDCQEHHDDTCCRCERVHTEAECCRCNGEGDYDAGDCGENGAAVQKYCGCITGLLRLSDWHGISAICRNERPRVWRAQGQRVRQQAHQWFGRTQ